MDELVNNSDSLEQLMILKGLTARTGALHEAQVQQLKTWPLIATHATSSEFEFDFTTKTLIFNLLKVKGNPPPKFDKCLFLLCKWTQTLLGEDYTVKIKYKNKPIYIFRDDDNVERFTIQRKPARPTRKKVKRARKRRS